MNVEDKIRSLLSLANQRDNANEAKSAREMAQRLADKHGLDLAAFERDEAAAASEPQSSDLIEDLSEELVDVAVHLFADLMRGRARRTKTTSAKESILRAQARVRRAQARARRAQTRAQARSRRAQARVQRAAARAKSRKRDGT